MSPRAFRRRWSSSWSSRRIFNANMERLDEKLETIAERQLQVEERQLKSEERHDKEMSQIRAELRRGIRLSIEEQRRERVRRKQLEKELLALRTAQAQTDQQLKAFIASLQKPANGNH